MLFRIILRLGILFQAGRRPPDSGHSGSLPAPHYSHAHDRGTNGWFSDAEPHHPMTHVNPQPYGSETAISKNKRLESRGK